VIAADVMSLLGDKGGKRGLFGTSKRMAASIHEDDGRLHITVSDGRSTIRVGAEGEIEFTDDDRDVARLERGGSFEIEQREKGTKHRLEVRPGDGGLERRYWLNGDEQAFGAEAQTWLAEALQTVFRRTGYGAEGRAKRILDREGVKGLLQEIESIESDYSRRIYYGVLLQHGDLDIATLRTIVQQAGREIGSDYELAELLLAELLIQASRHRLDAATCEAYVEAANSLDSDYEHRRVLAAMLEKGEASPEITHAVLQSAAGFQSDYDTAELLIQLLKAQPSDAELSSEFVEATRALDSDYEHRRVLAVLLERRDLGRPLLLSVLRSAPEIVSEY
jgi:hypothetical protein